MNAHQCKIPEVSEAGFATLIAYHSFFCFCRLAYICPARQSLMCYQMIKHDGIINNTIYGNNLYCANICIWLLVSLLVCFLVMAARVKSIFGKRKSESLAE